MQKTINASFLVLISVFFFWGFVAASNSILIPVFKDHFKLSQTQAMWVDVCFYVAYTIGSLLYLAYTFIFKKSIIEQLGYKNGIALGLCISALGTLLFIPAAQWSSFYLMLMGLFVVGLGFSLQQTAANPLVIQSGNPQLGSQRLSLAGGINNVGTTLAPVLIAYAIFGSVEGSSSKLDIHSIQLPFSILGLCFAAMALLFYLSKIPNPSVAEEGFEPQNTYFINNIKIPQVGLGMIAIFLYVGVEVATAANLPEFMKRELQVPTSQVAPFVSLFWASLMIGRWTGASAAFQTNATGQSLLRWILPYVAFFVYLGINALTGRSMEWAVPYFWIIPIVIVSDVLSQGKPERQLCLFSVLGIVALVFGMVLKGVWSAFALTSVGLFCSTLWPCIFTIAIRGMGAQSNVISSYLIMMIMGGGWISLLQGKLADAYLGIRYSFIIGILCFMYLVWYGWKAQKWKQNQL